MTPKTNTSMRRSAQAGRKGPTVRSDCWVEILPADTGGIEIELQSKVESMYGEATRKLVRDELVALEVDHALVKIEDGGALPFVIAARVETAVRRLGGKVGEGFLMDFGPGAQGGTQRDRLRRSRLYLPGNEPKFMVNAGLHQPDGIILDLEDSVAPTEKDAARVLVRNALRAINFYKAERMVRINQGERGLEDLEYLVAHHVHVVLIPKVESAEQVQRVDARIRELAQRAGQPSPAAKATPASESDDSGNAVYLMPIIESALGAWRAFEIATACDRIVALTIGLEDYTADIGAARTSAGRESFWARSQVVNAARAAGVSPIDTIFSDVQDMEGLRASAAEAKSLGFDGKGCIHPRQIQVIHDAFRPSEIELERARRIVAAFDEARAQGLGVVSLGSKMIDPPVVKRALHIVELAKRSATIP